MKFLPTLFLSIWRNRSAKRNLSLLIKFLALLIGIITAFSLGFHLLMLYEGKDYSLITGFYWTLTVMSTLGFGDITFTSDAGRLFSIVVLLSGIILLLVMLPFTFIQFFYAPWLEAQVKARAPRELPEDTENHVIMTNLEPIARSMMKKLAKEGMTYVLLVDELQQTLKYHDLGYNVVFGDPGDPVTYERLRVDKAALVILTNDDMINTKIAFTIREICKTVPIVANADEEHSIDILEFAGCTHVFPFMRMLGLTMGRRTTGPDIGTNIIGRFEELYIVEAPVMHTPIAGKSLTEVRLREKTGVTVAGFWKRGRFEQPEPLEPLDPSLILVLTGTEEQIKRYEEQYGFCTNDERRDAPVLILGGGRVGTSAAEALRERNIPFRILEKSPKMAKKGEQYIIGNAADINTLRQAGIDEARAVLITTHNDAVNIYLTIYCRQLRPDMQIISRAIRETGVSKLHSAGADLVMSFGTMGSNSITNLLRPDEELALADGLNIFRTPLPHSLVDRNLEESSLRDHTGCSVIAINRGGEMISMVDPYSPLKSDDELILIGTPEAEENFRKFYR